MNDLLQPQAGTADKLRMAVDALEKADAAARSGAAMSAAGYSVSAERLGEEIYKTTTPDTLELRRKAEAADPMLVSGKASLKVMTEFLRVGFEAQRPIPRRKSDPEKDAAFLLAAAAAVVPLLDRVEAAEGRGRAYRTLLERIKNSPITQRNPYWRDWGNKVIAEVRAVLPAPTKEESQ